MLLYKNSTSPIDTRTGSSRRGIANRLELRGGQRKAPKKNSKKKGCAT